MGGVRKVGPRCATFVERPHHTAIATNIYDGKRYAVIRGDHEFWDVAAGNFLLTSVGLVVYWFYHKYKLEREQNTLCSRHGRLCGRGTIPTRTRATAACIRRGIVPIQPWSNVSNDSNIDLNSQIDHNHSTTVSYGALDDNSSTGSEWSGLRKTCSLKHSFAQTGTCERPRQ